MVGDDASVGRPRTSVRTPVRTWPRALGLAAAAVYGAQLVPLVTTDLLDHGHCLGIYLHCFVVFVGLAPGIQVRIASGVGDGTEEVVMFAVAAAVTALLIAIPAGFLRRSRRGGLVAIAVSGLLSALLSLAATAFIRA